MVYIMISSFPLIPVMMADKYPCPKSDETFTDGAKVMT